MAVPEIRKHAVISDHRFQYSIYDIRRQRRDGDWQESQRIVLDKGDGAAVLMVNPDTDHVILIRQMRFPAVLNGGYESLIEVCAGVIENESPKDTVLREAEEETGYRPRQLRQVMAPFMSPGAVTEKLYLFVAEYSAADKVSDGGGVKRESEDIEVLEVPFNRAWQWVQDGTIQDAKTILLLQWWKLHLRR